MTTNIVQSMSTWKKRMRRLMAMIESGCVDVGATAPHSVKIDDNEAANLLSANQRDGMFKVAITP